MEQIWSLLKRHRRKFYYSGLLATGGYYLYQYVKTKLQEFEEEELKRNVTAAEKQHHFDDNHRSCNLTVLSFLPKMIESLNVFLDTKPITDLLKEENCPKENKLHLWDQLKTLIFSRAIAAIHLTVYLIVLLRIEMNILAGRLFQESQRNGTLSQIDHHHHLHICDFALNDGLREMAKDLQQNVEQITAHVSLKQPMSMRAVQDIFDAVRLKQGVYCDILRYALPSLTDHKDESFDKQLYTELQDVVLSRDCRTLVESLLDVAYQFLLDEVQNTVGQSNDLPLAKFIPKLEAVVQTLLSEAPNLFVQQLLTSEMLRTFAANVYEAFSMEVADFKAANVSDWVEEFESSPDMTARTVERQLSCELREVSEQLEQDLAEHHVYQVDNKIEN